MEQPFMVFWRNYFRNFPSNKSQERNIRAASATFQERGGWEGEGFAFGHVDFHHHSLAEVFRPLNRQRRHFLGVALGYFVMDAVTSHK